ncbi:uncharacterized protein LOC143235678 [Tachypleus tridentatus]|uniref:uncharacterized protein LOC143235678 n=1 Tax=Tachypleus tridentatus TaxID=6853 RepID=UPI003FCFFF8E
MQNLNQNEQNSTPAKTKSGKGLGTRNKAPRRSETCGAEQNQGHQNSIDNSENGIREEETSTRRKSLAPKEPAIVYNNVNDKLSNEENRTLRELEEYMVTEGGAWALGAPHLDLIGKFLLDKKWPVEVKILILSLIQAAAFKDDVILLLYQDRKDHFIMRYVTSIKYLNYEEQENVAKLLCNLCHQGSSFDWLMYISEWDNEGQSTSYSRATIKATVHALQSDRPPVKEKGVSLIFNLARKEITDSEFPKWVYSLYLMALKEKRNGNQLEVPGPSSMRPATSRILVMLFDETATELSMVVLQFLQGEVTEEEGFRCLSALHKFMCISVTEVPILLKMLGPNVEKFSGKSERIELLEQIRFRMSASVLA